MHHSHGLRTTTRDDGDFVDVALFGADTTWLRQVHGARVVVVESPGQHAGAEADAAVTAVPGARLAIRTADCVPITLTSGSRGDAAPAAPAVPSSSPRAVVGVVHAGWKGLVEGVVAATVARMHDLGAEGLRAHIGPCIHAECYEFGEPELTAMAARFGPGVRSTTSAGTPALDLVAAARAALAELDVREPSIDVDESCTACAADRYFSWRARREAERFATIAWIEP